MGRYVFKRVIIGVITLFCLSSATFFLMRITPGSPVSSERYKTEEAYEAAKKKYHLDKPLYEQYTIYLTGLVQGDLGESMVKTGKYVSDTVVLGFPVTAKLGTVAFATALLVGISLGTAAALSKQKWINNVCMFVATIGVSLPSFVLAVIMIIVIGVKLRLLPFIGLDGPLNYVLPVISLSMYPISMICRLTRSSILEVMKQDYIILARSKGTPYKKVILKHALKNAMLPVVTYAGPAFAYLLTGSFVIENIYSIPGIGNEMVSALSTRDYPMIMGLTIFLGFLVIAFNLLTDIISALLDPRIKLK